MLSWERKHQLQAVAEEPSYGSDTTQFDVETIRNAKERMQPVITVTRGLQIGKTVILETDLITIGRDANSDIALIDSGISRHHARIERRDGIMVIVDLESTNGVRVNGDLCAETVLRAGDKIQLGPDTILKFRVEDPDEVRTRVEQYERSIRDDLTGIHNRRHFTVTLARELAYVSRRGSVSSVILFDIDHFKQVNDNHGHREGDRVLIGVANTVGTYIRQDDMLARWGGEEFAILLRNMDLEKAHPAAERIREKIENMRIDTDGQPIQITVSLGVTEIREDGNRTVDTVIKEADERLYRAKHEGRNRTVAA